MSDNEDMEEFSTLVRNSKENKERPRTADSPDVAISSNVAEEKRLNAKMWANSGRDYFPTESAVDVLKPGQYVVNHSDHSGVYFSEREINLDNLLVLPDSNSQMVLEHIEEFWKNEQVFREYGFLWKRGIMLWGPPGSGKTSLIQQLSKQIVDQQGITVYCGQPNLTAAGLEVLRRIEPTRPIIVIFEDIDAIVSEYGESDLLAMLDGEMQVDNVVFIATTNYPDRLDKRFISRFDLIVKIGMPTPSAREYYLSHKNSRLDSEPRELKEWVEATEGFSIAHLKELIISVECFDNTTEDAIKRLRSMMNATISSYEDSERKEFGFHE